SDWREAREARVSSWGIVRPIRRSTRQARYVLMGSMSPRRAPDRRTTASLAISTEHVTTFGGVVCTGRRRGRRLGFPTANLTASGALPEDGVYAGRVGIDDEPAQRPAVVTVGTSPTFGDVDRRVEAHLLDFAGDLYGRRLCIVFVTRLGPVR